MVMTSGVSGGTAKKYTGQWQPGNASSYGSQNPNIPQAGPPGLFGEAPMLGKDTPGNWAGIFGDIETGLKPSGTSGASGGMTGNKWKAPLPGANGLAPAPSAPEQSGLMAEIMGFGKEPYASPEDIARRKTEALDQISGTEQDAALRLGQYAGAMGFGSSGGIQAGQRRLAEDFGAQRTQAGNQVEDWASEQRRQQGRDRLTALGLAGNLEMSGQELAAKKALAEAQMGHETSLAQMKMDFERDQAELDRKMKLRQLAASLMGQRGGGGGEAVSQKSALASRADNTPGMAVKFFDPQPFAGRF